MTGDNYARDWVAGAWRKLGFEYIRSSRPKGAIYLESLPVFTRGLARLPDHARLVRELRLLERRTHRSGKDTVEHPRNGHDDHANVVCGVFSLLSPPAFEQPSAIVMPVVCGAPRYVPGGSSLGYADAVVMPTPTALEAPPSAPAASVAPPAEPGKGWRGPQDGAPSWLRKVEPAARRVDGGPPVAKPGHVTEQQRLRVNADKSVEHRVMGNARMAQPDNIPGGFSWGGSKGRAW